MQDEEDDGTASWTEWSSNRRSLRLVERISLDERDMFERVSSKMGLSIIDMLVKLVERAQADCLADQEATNQELPQFDPATVSDLLDRARARHERRIETPPLPTLLERAAISAGLRRKFREKVESMLPARVQMANVDLRRDQTGPKWVAYGSIATVCWSKELPFPPGADPYDDDLSAQLAESIVDYLSGRNE